MYFQSYEDYIRTILGYPVQNEMSYNTYPNCSYEYIEQPRYSSEIMDLYPDIYKIINPMVCKICKANSKPITRELVEQMTDEIYLNIENDTTIEEDVVNVRVNLPPTKPESNSNNRQVRTRDLNNENSSSKKIRDNRQENVNNVNDLNKVGDSQNRIIRPFRRNNTLRDLIKILILNQLLGGRRPHIPNPPRPPFPGNPGPRPGPGPRPPIQPRGMYLN